MERFSRRLAALGFGLAALVAGSAQAQVVISQVYGGGGNTGAQYKSDFIELHNTGATAVDLAGWSVQYASANGSSWARTELSGSVAPGAYYLVKQADGAGSQPALPAPDAIGTIAMSGSAGKVLLVRSTTAQSGACPTGMADFVGYGSVNCVEGSAAAPGLSNSTAAIRIDDCVDTNDNRADFKAAAPAPRNRSSTPRLCGDARILASVDDVSVAEGNTGSSSLTFTVTLTRPAGPGGARIRWSTVDGSAAAGSDFTAVVDAEAFIAEGADRVQLVVDVNGDAAIESDETLRVVLTGFTGAEAGDAEGLGTILNDDFAIVPIAQIQGAGVRSPLEGTIVGTRGVVIGRKADGFFIQSRDVDADADPATSEGVFVYTKAEPPAFVQAGRWVAVQGLVAEFVPPSDPGQAPLTEMASKFRIENGKSVLDRALVVVPVDGTTYPLPAPVELTTTFPDPAGPLDQLERVESMRVIVRDFVASAPTAGNTSESQATGSSNGRLFGTVAGLPRPFREPGIQTPDAPPAGTIPPIPQWDFNPEVLSVDSDALGQPLLDLAAGAHVADLAGPLSYGFRRYGILPDSYGTVTPGAAPRAAMDVPADAFTVAGYNMERFFDDVDDAGVDDVRLSAAGLERRLSKASLGIREALRTPDILGVVEMENLAVLQRVADRVNADAVVAGAPNPNYVPYLVEGNDPGGIDVGFLVKTAEVAARTPRVEVLSVVQVGKDTTYITPTGGTSLLNDRPPLALSAVVHYADGRTFPLNVVIVHQRSLNGADEAGAEGERIRSKRQRQAEFLAAYLDARQKQAPDTRLVVLGDFNAFEFNDGLVDAMGTVTGAPAPDEQTAVYGDGNDLVEPNLVNLTTTEPRDERYSFTFDGNAQTLDHVLVNEDLVVATRDIRVDHARINADFPETNRSDAASPSRLADHDPVIAYFVPRRKADLSVTATGGEAHTGGLLTFGVDMANLGPEQADGPAIGFDLDAEVAGLTVTAPAGWTCDAPVVAAGHTTLTCDAGSLANGATAPFALEAPATAALFGRSITLVAAAQAESLDPVAGNNAASAVSTVVSQADLGVDLVAPGTHLRRGTAGVYRATVANAGPDLAVAPVLTLVGDAPAANVAIDAPAGWSCAVASIPTGFRGTCTADALSNGGAAVVTARIVGPQRPGQPHFTVQARVDTQSVDADAANDATSRAVVLTGTWR